MNRLILVSGSRDLDRWDEVGIVHDALSRHDPRRQSSVMHGCAPGVVTGAGEWAEHVPVIEMPAQWKRHGKSAGPKRNAEMVKVARAMWECGWDVVVLCFPRPNSRGTRDMITKARRAGMDAARSIGADFDRGGYGEQFRTERWSVYVHELDAT